MRTRIKICGIVERDDAEAAVAAGADALGFIFYEPSARYIEPSRAAEIIRDLPAFVEAVGVVVDLGPADLDNIARLSGVDYFQFHGDEDPEVCESAGRPYLKALRVQAGMDIQQAAGRYAGARGLLLDAFVRDLPGGTGSTFDWSRIPAVLPAPVFLAGGLHVDNVVAAIETVRPYGVDVSSGVEREPGRKDHDKIRQFVQSVVDADRAFQSRPNEA